MQTADVIRLIENQNQYNNTLILQQLINDNVARSSKQKAMWEEYKGDVPIFGRTFPDSTKINRTINNNFRGFIVNTKVGYFTGTPITYKTANEKLAERIEYFRKQNYLRLMDIDTAIYQSVCGFGARLVYIGTDGEPHAMIVPSWECIFIENQSLNVVDYAIRYYAMEQYDEKGYKKLFYKAEFYDNQNVSYYESDSQYNFRYIETKPHFFNRVPLIKFANNTIEIGDFELVTELIDAYDRTISDTQNELEEHRNAYMVATGANITTEVRDQARQTGAFSLPDDKVSLNYLVKDLSKVVEFFKDHKSTLEENIYKFSKSINFTDEKFASAPSGESRKYKLLPLENDTVLKECDFEKGIKQMFECVNDIWKENIEDLEIVFTRNLPIDLLNCGEIATKLKGIVSDETLLSLMPFIQNVEQEMERLREQNDVSLENTNESAEDNKMMDNNNDNQAMNDN